MEFVLTKEMIEEAADYLPLAQKTALAKQQAEICVQKAKETTGVKTDAGTILPLPPRYFVSEDARSMLEMSIFTALYLRVQPMDGSDIHMDGETYDKYAGSHIFGQLTAMKGKAEPELRAKIMNMLADFNDYQKRLGAEIRALMTLYNDPVDRFMAMNAALTTPEAMQGLLEELKDAAEAVQEQKIEKAGDEA